MYSIITMTLIAFLKCKPSIKIIPHIVKTNNNNFRCWYNFFSSWNPISMWTEPVLPRLPTTGILVLPFKLNIIIYRLYRFLDLYHVASNIRCIEHSFPRFYSHNHIGWIKLALLHIFCFLSHKIFFKYLLRFCLNLNVNKIRWTMVKLFIIDSYQSRYTVDYNFFWLWVAVSRKALRFFRRLSVNVLK